MCVREALIGFGALVITFILSRDHPVISVKLLTLFYKSVNSRFKHTFFTKPNHKTATSQTLDASFKLGTENAQVRQTYNYYSDERFGVKEEKHAAISQEWR